MNQVTANLLLLLTLTAFVQGCNNLSTEEQAEPIEFLGITSINASGNGQFIINWNPPPLVEVESYEIYMKEMGSSNPGGSGLALYGDQGDSSFSLNGNGLENAGDATAIELAVEDSPSVAGTLMGIEPGSSTNFITPSLEPGGYAFQVKVLLTDGRKDDLNKSYIVTVSGQEPFQGLQIAEIIGSELYLEWLPYPNIREGEDFRYTIYRGQGMDTVVGFTKETSLTIDISKEEQGATFFYGVRYTNGQAQEEKNTITLPVIMPVRDVNYLGCLEADGIGSDRVRVKFEWPSDNYESIRIYRGQKEAFVAFRPEEKVDADGNPIELPTQFIDIGLQEGENYTYTCQGVTGQNVIVGTNSISGTPLTKNAPTFDGIKVAGVPSEDIRAKLTENFNKDANLRSLDEPKIVEWDVPTNDPIPVYIKKEIPKGDPIPILVKWGVPTGVPADSIKVYSNVGLNVDWENPNPAVIEPNTTKLYLLGFGDDLPYSVGVRACAKVCDTGTDVCEETCDSNVEQFTVDVSIDLGAPQTTGVDNAVVDNGRFIITAPWTDIQGGIQKRQLWVKTGGTEGNPADFVLKSTITVEDPANPPTTLYYADIENKQDYTFRVIDIDKHGNSNESAITYAENAGDIIPPDFQGISGLAAGPEGQEETTLTAIFEGVVPQNIDPSGAHAYRFYIMEGTGNACGDEELFAFEVEAKKIPIGEANYVIPNLKAKTMYSVCIQAIDEAGNISKSELSRSRQTLDTTPPVFDGIQALKYDKDESSLSVEWFPSSSDDIHEYEVHISIEDKDNNPVYGGMLIKSHADAPNGALFNSQTVPFGSENYVNVFVRACDRDAVTNTRNCTEQFDLSTAIQIQLDDVAPPQGFWGISSADSQDTTVEGQITVRWQGPSDPTEWPEYRGFKIYDINPETEELTLLKDCLCLNPNCSDQMTECTVSVNDDYRVFNLHVRAYDSKFNLTDYLSPPMAYSATVRSGDNTPPVFNSNLSAQYLTGDNNVQINWDAATDNQYADDPEVFIGFKVYRKEENAGSGFADPTDPGADGSLLTDQILQDPEVSRFEFVDGDSLKSGTKYFYTVCAYDTAGNTRCDGSVRDVDVPDNIEPTIAEGSFVSDKGVSDKVWGLTWDMSDDSVADADLRPTLWIVPSTDKNLELNQENVASQPDAVMMSLDAGLESITNLSGPPLVDIYVHYLLIVKDFYDNVATAQTTVFSQNLMEITSVSPNEGSLAGGKLVIIKGKGFHSSSKVYINNEECTTTTYLSDAYLSCDTPSGSIEGQMVVKVDIDLQDSGETIFTQAASSSPSNPKTKYSYCTEDSTCVNPCNNPATSEVVTSGARFTRTAGRGTDAALPYIICTRSELDKIRNEYGGRYYELGDNIDMGGSGGGNWNPIQTVNSSGRFRGVLDGKGFAIANLYIDRSSTDYVGFLRILGWNDVVKNLGIINADVTGRHRVGALAGALENDLNTKVEDVYMTGSVLGQNHVGGIAGQGGGSTYRLDVNATVQGNYEVGGLFGYRHGSGSDLTFRGTVKIDRTGSHDQSRIGGIAGAWWGAGGTSSNLKVINADISVKTDGGNGWHSGGVIGIVQRENLENLEFSGTISGRHETGGLIGRIDAYDTARRMNVKNGIVRDATLAGRWRSGGAFGLIYRYTTVENITVDDIAISSPHGHFGGLAGEIDGDYQNSTVQSETDLEERKALCETYNSFYDETANWCRFPYVKNSNVKVTITATGNEIGGAFGDADYGYVDNVTAAGSVTGRDSVGGFVGRTYRTHIVNSSTSADVSASRNYIGGFLGHAQTDHAPGTTILNSSATGDVIATDSHGVGGFAGVCRGTYKNNFSTGTVTANRVSNDGRHGGFCGGIWAINNNSYNILEDNYATGDVISDINRVGGFAGWLHARISMVRNYSTGDVRGKFDTGGHIGGLEGSYIQVDQSYSTGNVFGEDYSIGGFVGSAWANTTTSAITQSYATGNVQGNINVGGFAGYTRIRISESYSVGEVSKYLSAQDLGGFIGDQRDGRVTNDNYYDKETSKQTVSQGGNAKTTEEMKEPETFGDWDQGDGGWNIESGRYPLLEWQVNP